MTLNIALRFLSEAGTFDQTIIMYKMVHANHLIQNQSSGSIRIRISSVKPLSGLS